MGGWVAWKEVLVWMLLVSQGYGRQHSHCNTLGCVYNLSACPSRYDCFTEDYIYHARHLILTLHEIQYALSPHIH